MIRLQNPHVDGSGNENWRWSSLHDKITTNKDLVRVINEKLNIRFTEAGLLSIPVTSAKVESAIMSLLELDSHSIVSSCSCVCLRSTTPITLTEYTVKMYTKSEKPIGTHPHCWNTILVQPFFDTTEHPFEMPFNQMPSNAENNLLALDKSTC